MKHLITIQTFFFLIFMLNVNGQEYFEGEIDYKIEYETLNPNISVSYLEKEIGSSFTAYIKEDRYTIIYHGTGQQGWMKIIVRLDQNYTYTEFEKSDTIVKTKYGTEKDELIAFKRNPENKKEILGVLCESITINYKPTNTDSFFQTFKGKYYFDPKYKLNVNLYKNYTDGFWNLFVEESESISLRNETEFSPLFKTIQEATSIEKKNIQFSMFEPNESKIIHEK